MPFWPVILVECGLATALHLALVLAVVAPNLYAVERAAGLADLTPCRSRRALRPCAAA